VEPKGQSGLFAKVKKNRDEKGGKRKMVPMETVGRSSKKKNPVGEQSQGRNQTRRGSISGRKKEEEQVFQWVNSYGQNGGGHQTQRAGQPRIKLHEERPANKRKMGRKTNNPTKGKKEKPVSRKRLQGLEAGEELRRQKECPPSRGKGGGEKMPMKGIQRI